jgi:hypothetical protein
VRNELGEQKIICVLGMHRSGTSLLTRLLNLLGVDLGSTNRLTTEPADANPKGYWENHDLTSISDAILKRFGGAWDEPPVFPAGWQDDVAIDDLRLRAQEFIRQQFSQTSLCGWKDPRTCLTLPFWQQQFADLQYIICLRHPLAVAASLARRDGFSYEKSCRLWLLYVLSALHYTDGKSRLLLFYEDLMSDSERELDRLAEFTGTNNDPEIRNAMRQFVDPSLYHHRSEESTTGNSEAENEAQKIYRMLRNNDFETTTSSISDESGETIRRLTSQVQTQARALHEREQRLALLENQLTNLQKSNRPWDWLTKKK